MVTSTEFIESKLAEREKLGLLRSLTPENNLVDFSSNDYLGFSKSRELEQMATVFLEKEGIQLNGATGSRLISGNYLFTEKTESFIADFHQAEAALIFNSGYDANLGLLSALPQKGDTIITDELVHASIIDGARLSYAERYKFAHNDCDELEKKLKLAKGTVYVTIESVYSMDGDIAPLLNIASLCATYGANLIVDEAHAIGVIGNNGEGLVQHLKLVDQVFARVVTFGKALGSHGAAVLGTQGLRNYLLNFARSFIYTTALPPHQVALINAGYQLLSTSKSIDVLKEKINLFKSMADKYKLDISKNGSAIQTLIIGNNEDAKAKSRDLATAGFYARAILSPTVSSGKERLRICLHAFNSDEEIQTLIKNLATIR